MSNAAIRRPPRSVRNASESSRRSEEPQVPSAMASAVIATFQQAGTTRRRAMTNGSSDKEREQKIEDEMRTQRRIRERAPGRRPTMNGDVAQDTDALINKITEEWDGLLDGDYNPIDVALRLQDETSGGVLSSFQRTQVTLSRALSGTAHDHHHAFDSALPHHTTLLQLLGNVQTQTTDVRSVMQEVKDALSNKRSDLAQLRSRSQSIEEILRLLDQIEYLKVVPDALELFTSGKQLLRASVLLIRSLKTINEQDLLEIGAVADLRAYLVSQEIALKDILIDELHNHLYLRSFWSESRWGSFSHGQQSSGHSKSRHKSSQDATASCSMPTDFSGLHNFLNNLASRTNNSPLDLADPRLTQRMSQRMSASAVSASMASLSPRLDLDNQSELDSFTYLETLLESLAVLGKLGNGLDVLRQRLPNEIFSLVDRTLEEVAERAEVNRQLSSSNAGAQAPLSGVHTFSGHNTQDFSSQASSTRLTAFENSENSADQETLRDLLWTLYTKLDVVTQGLRAVYEIANRIGSRRDSKDAAIDGAGTIFPLTEVWLPIQDAMRTLLKSYLSGEERSLSSSRDAIVSVGGMLREGKVTHDRAESLFHFADTDQKPMNKDIKQHEDNLMRILGETVPGVQNLSGTGKAAIPQTALVHVGAAANDRSIGTDSHRLLITPDPSHLGVVFHPTLAFLHRVATILPSALDFTRATSIIFDDFVLNVYLPQLEEKAAVLLQQALTGLNALQADRASLTLSEESLVQASTQLVSLMNTIRTTPFHREFCANILVGLIIQFYQRCNDRFHALVSSFDSMSGETHMVISAGWAQKSELSVCLAQLMNVMDDEEELIAICDRETRLELEVLGEKTIARDDLLQSSREIASLGRLYRSLSWFMEQLKLLEDIPEDQSSQTAAVSEFTLSLLPPGSADERTRVPLSSDMSGRVDALLGIYRRFLEVILHTLRLEMRCRVLHYIGKTTSSKRHSVDSNARKPDSYIIDLNDELCSCEEALAAVLPEQERRFVFEGLGLLMEHLLIREDHSGPNAKKTLRNIFALRQNLKTMSNNSEAFDFQQALSQCGLRYQGRTAI